MKNSIRIICIIVCVAVVVGFVPTGNSSNDVLASEFFSDVLNEDDFWFYPVYWGATNKIVYGYSDGTFRPANQCTRAQMVTFIWRIAGKPEPKNSKNPFSDISKDDYWYKPALWGNENHIVEGYSDGTFRPQNLCTRKQAVTFLWRLAGKPDIKSSTNKFSDVKEGEYYYKAVLWASKVGIVAGYEDGTFKPSGNCLRRQMVTFLYKFCKQVYYDKIDAISFSDKITMDTDIDYDAIDQAKSITPSPTPSPTPKPNFKSGKTLGKVSEKQRGSFTLEGKTASDILKLIKSFAKVSTGDIAANYPKRFPVKPDYKSDSGLCCDFRTEYNKYDGDYSESIRSVNCVKSVCCNVVEEMNGKITVENNSYVSVILYLNDYDVAAELYDKLYKYLLTFHDNSMGSSDNRKGTYWTSRVYVNGYGHTGTLCMQRETYNDYKGNQSTKRTRFYIEIHIPIKEYSSSY